MKNKIINILAIGLLASFIGIGDVDAEIFKEGDRYQKSEDPREAVAGLTDGAGKTLNQRKYVFTKETAYDGYCLDPNLVGSNNTTISVDRIVGGKNTASKKNDIYDQGLLAIASSSGNYATKLLAIRAWTMGVVNYGNRDGGLSPSLSSSFVNLGIRAAKHLPTETAKILRYFNSSCSGDEEAIERCMKTRANSDYPVWYASAAEFNFQGTEASNAYSAATELVHEAIRAAAKYVDELEAGNIAEIVKVNKPENPTVVDKENSDVNIDTESSIKEKFIYFDFNIEGLDNLDFDNSEISNKYKMNNLSVVCDDCASKGITVGEIGYGDPSSEGQAFFRLDSTTNLLEVAKRQNGKVRVVVAITIDNDICTDPEDGANLRLLYDLSTDDNSTIGYNGWIGAILKHDNQPEVQRYVIFKQLDNANGDGTPGTGDGENPSHQDEVSVFIKCDPNDEEPDEPEENEPCESELKVPYCTEDEEDSTVYYKAYKESGNVKKCILENKDDAGNSYRLSESQGGVADDNPYCQIYCKEDYAKIQFTPVIKEVKCGGKIYLHAAIDGQKECYTSGGKDNDYAINDAKFKEDLVKYQKLMVEATNAYSKAASIREKLDDLDGRVNFCENQIDTSTEAGQEMYEDNCEDISISGGYSAYVAAEQDSGEVRAAAVPSGGFAWDIEVDDIANLEDYKDDYDDEMEEAEIALGDAQNKLTKAIEDYKACSENWWEDLEYPFDQKIYFDYAEPYDNELLPSDPYDPKRELKPVDNYTEDDEDTDTETDETTEPDSEDLFICDGDVDDEYSVCSSGSTNDVGIDNRSYLECTTSEDGVECDNTRDEEIPSPRYIKKTWKKSAKYETQNLFSQAYPSGKVTTNTEYTGPVPIVDLENKLPIATSSTYNGKFKLVIQDLGEFYNEGENETDGPTPDDSDNRGRIIDFEGGNEDMSVAHAKKTDSSDTFNGQYVCYYENQCRPDPNTPDPDPDCPNCNVSCVQEDGTVKYEPEWCEFPITPECPECEVECIGCLFNFDELQLNFKTVSTNNFDSANRELGYNWISDVSRYSWVTNADVKLGLIARKASATIAEIEEKNDTIYSDNPLEDNRETSGSELAFTVKMTPAVTSWLTDYNDRHEDDGGYLNTSLKCYDAGGFKKIFCFSEVVDELVSRYDARADHRTDEGDRANNPNVDGYWTLWDEYTRLDEEQRKSVIGGPSWK